MSLLHHHHPPNPTPPLLSAQILFSTLPDSAKSALNLFDATKVFSCSHDGGSGQVMTHHEEMAFGHSDRVLGGGHIKRGKMAEHSAENLLNSIMENFADTFSKQKFARFSDEGISVSTQTNKLFGRQKSVHEILGGGKSADVLLGRNKKISSSLLVGVTAVWVLFEWLNYHFLTIVCFALVFGMLGQLVWSNASGILNKSISEAPRLVLPNDLFVNIAVCVGAQINQFLGFIQDVACGRNERNLKQFVMVVAGLSIAAVIGSWCNFLTVLYIGYVSAHILPILYERYEDQVDDFVYNLLGQLQSQYQKLDESVLSKIPKGNLKSKKIE